MGETVVSYGRPMDVELVRWPNDGSRLDRARRVGAPRLLLVEDGEVPPVTFDPLEDWIRVPAEPADVRARVEVLTMRARAGASQPRLEDRVLRHREQTIVLSEVEALLMAVLLDGLGAVVTRAELVAGAWPDGVSGRNTVDVAVGRLRRRLEPVGFRLRTVRSRGYLLELVPPATGPEVEPTAGLSESCQETVPRT